jgi:4-hydroxybenzoate polyprenyltransferase
VSTPSNIVPPKGARDGQLMRGQSLLVRLANFVKLPHTVFAMPFSLVGVIFASVVAPVTPAIVGWVLLAFTSARFAAMAFNRLVDRDVDALNPRTAMRELPAGTLTVGQAKLSIVVSSTLFIFASFMLNPLCLALSPVALLWVLGYSYTKRFTRWSHLWLGLGLSMAPVGGYLAVTGAWSEPVWLLLVLAAAVVCWSGGFDMIYALQDAEFDTRHGLHSVPSTFGVHRAVGIARLLHVLAVGGFAAVVAAQPLGNATPLVQGILWAAVAGIALMLLWEHRLVKADDLSRIDAAFFTMNGLISLGFLAFVLTARLLCWPLPGRRALPTRCGCCRRWWRCACPRGSSCRTMAGASCRRRAALATLPHCGHRWGQRHSTPRSRCSTTTTGGLRRRADRRAPAVWWSVRAAWVP